MNIITSTQGVLEHPKPPTPLKHALAEDGVGCNTTVSTTYFTATIIIILYSMSTKCTINLGLGSINTLSDN